HPGVALLPWITWSLARSRARSPGGIAISSLLIGMDLLAGDAFGIVLALVVGVLWIFTEKERQSWPPAIASLVLACALSVLLALPQIVATAYWIPETTRAVSGMKLSETLRFVVSPWRLLEFLIPYAFGPTWTDGIVVTWARQIFGSRAAGFFP